MGKGLLFLQWLSWLNPTSLCTPSVCFSPSCEVFRENSKYFLYFFLPTLRFRVQLKAAWRYIRIFPSSSSLICLEVYGLRLHHFLCLTFATEYLAAFLLRFVPFVRYWSREMLWSKFTSPNSRLPPSLRVCILIEETLAIAMLYHINDPASSFGFSQK